VETAVGILFGEDLFGKVDQVPGLCHVRTRFLHVMFFPLGPTASFLIVKSEQDSAPAAGAPSVFGTPSSPSPAAAELGIRRQRQPMCEVAIRCDGGDFLTITLLGRSHPGATDYWDGNWVRAAVELSAGGFRGSVGGDLRSEELSQFHDQLVRLQQSLRGIAEFETMERWLSIRVTGDGKGHMEFRCNIRDRPGIGNTLDCTLATDQTFTRSTVTELGVAVRAFPVIGKP
jgi:hypothetical protein